MTEEKFVKLKKLIDELAYTGDDIAFDQALSQIDLAVYDLRQECFAPRRASKVDWDNILSDLERELDNEKA